mgnify:CR=1 FL=1
MRSDPVTPTLREAVLERDNWVCVGLKLGWASHTGPPWMDVWRLELDHVRSSGALGKKSRSTLDNLVTLCSTCHCWKTEHGREARPLLLAYLEGFG